MSENSVALKRNPSIELLRIIMMIQIVFLHVSVNGFMSIIYRLDVNTKLAFWIIWVMCRCPVFIYIIITGYFMSISEGHINWNKIIRCYLPMLFYSITIPIIYGFARHERLPNNQMVKAYFPFLSRTWYFLTLYLLILILSPFLNKMIKNLDRKQFLQLIGICFFLFSVWQPLSKLYPFKGVIGVQKIIYTEGGKSLYDFIYMYLLGAYLRRYHILKKLEEDTDKKNIWNKPILYLIAFFAFGLINVLLIYIYPDKGILTIAGYNDNPMVVLQCIVLFRFFEKIDLRKHIKAGKVINTISAANLGIYMIHEHALIRNLIWKDIFHIGEIEFYQRPYWALYLVLIIFAVYITCWIIDYVRKLLWIPVAKVLKVEGKKGT